jgi:hypothetical protein
VASIEEIAGAFAGIPVANGNQWSLYPLHAGRVFLSRDDTGRFSLFLTGAKESFGQLPRISGIDFSDDVEAVPTGEHLQALRLTSSSLTFGNRVMAHVAYELSRQIERDAQVTNEHLVSEIRWIFELLDDRDTVMSADLQKGLVGECVFLRKLLMLCAQLNLPRTAALERWWGFEKSKRDFAAKGTAVEVKTTSRDTRQHVITGMQQLEPQDGEQVYLYSLGVKADPSAPKKLPDFVQEVADLLVGPGGAIDPDLQERFYSCLRRYGYEPTAAHLYRLVPGFLNFHLPPRLFRESELHRLRWDSFKGEALPDMVVDVSYRLEARSPELSLSEERAVLETLLRAEALG